MELDSTYMPLLEGTEVYHEINRATTPEAVTAVIRKTGAVMDCREKADLLAEQLDERIDIIRHKLKFIPREQRPGVLCVRDLSPTVLAHDEYLNSLIEVAGGVPYTDWDKDGFNPDILILITDRPVPELLHELPAVLGTRQWAPTNAVKNNGFYLVYNTQYLRQPGAAVADDIEILAEIINPRYFIFGRDADVWMPFELQ